VKIEWIDSVRSTANHAMKVSASSTANTGVVTSSGTLYPSLRLSVISVPTMLTSTTVTQ